MSQRKSRTSPAASRGKPREQAKRETREALLLAGMSLFSEEGIDVPSLDAICARAGFTRGAFYVHFRDRDDFLAAVIDRVLTDFVESVTARGEGGRDLVDTIDRFLTLAAQGKVPLIAHQRLLMHFMSGAAQHAEEMRARFKVLSELALARLASAAESSRDGGALKTPLAPDMVAIWLAAAALGLTTLLHLGVAVDLTRVQKSARELLQIDLG